MPGVTREDLRVLLTRWQGGEISHQQVYDWANERYGLDEWDAEDEVTKEVLAHLDILDMNLITTEDVPTFLAMLESEDEGTALRILEAHSKSFNLEERIAKWKDDPFYGPFCRPVGH